MTWSESPVSPEQRMEAIDPVLAEVCKGQGSGGTPEEPNVSAQAWVPEAEDEHFLVKQRRDQASK